MVVFNGTTFIQLLIVAIPALIAMGIASLLDGDGERWAELTGAIALIPLDLLWRLGSLSAGEEEDASEDSQAPQADEAGEGGAESKGGLLSMVSPSGGGHIFWLPNYLVGALITYGLLSGFFT